MARSVASTLAAASLPILLRLEPEFAHRVAMSGLKLLRSAWPPIDTSANLSVKCAGLRFAHPVGVAAGFDKDGDYLDALGAIGFSHIEVGTVTPRPQPGNPKPRLFRIPHSHALINRMGFNSKGVAHLVEQVRGSSFPGIRGISIGKNAATPIEHATEDYLLCLRAVYSAADYIAVNVSSPNTAKLRELQSAQGLSGLIGPLQEEKARLSQRHGKRVPIFVKIAPDLQQDELALVATELRRLGADGVIAANTTVDLTRARGVPAIYQGAGLSGAPLHPLSLAVISQLRSELGPEFPIIGVGGITSAEAASATLQAGANVIQVYTGLIYRGPALLYEILDALECGRR
jgi:dihydroorotate dehydrogenase